MTKLFCAEWMTISQFRTYMDVKSLTAELPVRGLFQYGVWFEPWYLKYIPAVWVYLPVTT